MKFLKKLLGLEDKKVIGLYAFGKKNTQVYEAYVPRFNAQNTLYSTNTKGNFFLL